MNMFMKPLMSIIATTTCVLTFADDICAQEPRRDLGSNEVNSRVLAGFFQEHCVKCHGEKKQNNGVRLDRLDPRIADHASLTKWQDVLDVLNTGEMPPEDEKQPEKDELTSAIGLVTDNISSARKRLAATGGVIKMRHLTKREYVGSMKDLFGDEVPPDILPDDVSGGFDTNGSAQFFSLKQYENFYKASRKVVQANVQSLVAALPKSAPLRHDPEIVPFETAKAQYEQMVKVMELIDAGALPAEIAKVDPKVADAGQVRLFKQRFEKRIVKPKTQYESLKGKKGLPGGFAYTVEVRPRSLYRLTIKSVETTSDEVDILVNEENIGSVQFTSGASQSSTINVRTGLFDTSINIRVAGVEQDVFDYVTLTGPHEDTEHVPSFFEASVEPVVQKTNPSDDEVTAMLRRFADRAFRYQGVDDEYIAELVKVYKLERDAGKSVADAVMEPLTAVVTAPAFLYLKEKNDGSRKVVNQLEFAIRVAYFLWGSPPDDELYALAKSNGLYDKTVMKSQFERMLASPRADVFLTDFINQWSDISRFDEIDLPVNLIRGGFQDSARRELSEFFKVLVRENRSLDNLIDSDFVVVDRQLARYYGLRAKSDEGFQKVSLPASSPRGGMLAQAAFLISGGSGPRTSPTIRGAIIREKFLHDPVPPPPPNIPAIENEKGQKLTVKQLVDRHKNVAQCASCHDRIDPIGYGLENFDYLGKWRTNEVAGGAAASAKPKKRKGKPSSKKPAPEKITIDASGYLGDDRFEDLEGLRNALSQHKDQLARSVYESLLSYGIGREIEFVDDEDVIANLSELKKRNYPLKEMIFEVITSKTFVTK